MPSKRFRVGAASLLRLTKNPPIRDSLLSTLLIISLDFSSQGRGLWCVNLDVTLFVSDGQVGCSTLFKSSSDSGEDISNPLDRQN